jgi:DNA-binding NarL/FixJ family response regulator
MIRIVIADDHTIMREGLKRILDGAPDIDIVGEAINGFEVLSHVRQGGFDLLLLDLSMPGRSGVDLIRQIRSEAPKLAILILTMHEEEQYAVRAIRAGAQGYLTKESAGTQLVGAIRKVASGRPYISTEVAEQLALNIMTPNEQLLHKQLSDREFEVFSLLVGGKSITEIANSLHLSVKTVSTHKTRIMQKMGMTSLSEMVQYAVAHRRLSPCKTRGRKILDTGAAVSCRSISVPRYFLCGPDRAAHVRQPCYFPSIVKAGARNSPTISRPILPIDSAFADINGGLVLAY